jgi:CheY-like chemotaxis protein
MNVLVIDDSELALAMMQERLREYGHHVVALPTPIGVTRIILKEDIHVVVVDVNLPSVRGDTLAKLFRQQPRMKRLGVVLVSGLETSELERLARESDADAVCRKMDIREQLIFAVQSAYNARK